MKKDAWVQILVGTIILGTLAFVAVKVVDITGTLGSVEAKVSNTSERVDRIAQVLPDVGVRIAQEEISRRIRTVVVASTPYAVRGGGLAVTLTVVDVAANTRWSTPIKLSSRDDRELVSALAWTGADLDHESSSFARMQEYCRIAKSDASVPAYLDARASFIMCSADADTYLELVSRMGVHPQKSRMTAEIDNWPTLCATLRKSEDVFKVAH